MGRGSTDTGPAAGPVRATSERLGEGDALVNLGNALQAADRLEEAIA
jgi:hypothetical protein